MYKDRQIYSVLEKQKDNQKITVLVGARQVGKTTVMRRLYEEIRNRHHALFLDLDIYSNYEQVSSYENFINTLKLNGYNMLQKDLFVIFLDEFQRYADISRVLKTVCDHHPSVKIYASGSSSLGINEQIQESLAGRKRIIHMYPLSFHEYLQFIEREDLIQKLGNLPNVRSDNLPELIPEAFQELEQFLIHGGYPEVTLVDLSEKREVLASIFDLYVKKDLVDFLKIERIAHAKTLIRQLSVNHGQETKYSQLAQVAGIDEKTAKNYLEILKETFIITVHPPWFTNRNKELVKMPKIYFLDSGVRNYFINNFNPAEIRSDMSFLFEGFVISELIKAGVSTGNIKFWRTKNKNEVDLILEDEAMIKPVEIKYKKQLKPSDSKGLRKFKEAYPKTENLFMVNLGTNQPGQGKLQHLSPFELERLTATPSP
jgi:uncharacterized protein